MRFSLIDFCMIYRGEKARDAFSRSVLLARTAEKLGFHRMWYAEHHNMSRIASSHPAILIAHVAAHTHSIRLGAGGVMLPNHAPLLVAEEFGMLAQLHPGRIDLGLGRAPGTDPLTLRALRRSPNAADTFAEDILELEGYLCGESIVPGVEAVPNAAAHPVPLYILGSSLYGAKLAARLGRPYAFASHFAPAQLHEALATYRREFRPSAHLSQPYVIAAVNVCAAQDTETAAANLAAVVRSRVRYQAQAAFKLRNPSAFPRDVSRDVSRETQPTTLVSDAEIDILLDSPLGRQVADMFRYTAVGTGPEVAAYLRDFGEATGADELMISLQSPTFDLSLQSLQILATSGVMDTASGAS